MAKEKVYKLAQDFKVSSEAMVQMLRSMGIAVKSHMSTVDDNLRDDIKKKFEQERAMIKREYDRKKLMFTKAREDVAVKTETVPEAAPPKSAPVAPTSSAPVVSQPASVEPAVRPAAQAVAASSSPMPYQPQSVQRPPMRPFVQRRSFGSETQQRTSQEIQVKVYTPQHNGGVIPPPSPPPPSDSGGHRSKKKASRKQAHIHEQEDIELKANIRKTLAKIGAGSAKRKYKKDIKLEGEQVQATDKKILNVSEFVTANELANIMNAKISEVIAKCLELGIFVTINQRLDFETIEMVADEFGFSAKLMSEYSEEDEEEVREQAGALAPRAPIVTVMGHVDHGKTSLLDYIRKTNVTAGEAGGITQHIAAYEVETKQGKVTFLDTPGHEAFTAMRARGSQITDVIVLIVAADSGVMPQTKEAIDHARAANVPIVVAINKVDLPVANIDRVKSELAQYNLLVEDYGGQISCAEISARTGKGIDRLLEILALETEILELKSTSEGKARGVVIESELDKGKGPVATVLIESGTLRVGDPFVTGIHSGRVRDMYNDRGISVKAAGPSQPVVVLGLSGTPQAGDSFRVTDDEKEAREISARRRLAQREREIRRIGAVSLDHLYEQIKAGSVQTLNLVIKGDVDGSVEALAASLEKCSTPEIKVNVIHKSVGAVTESNIMLAAASNALIIGFHLSPNSKIRDLAKQEGVDIRTYRIIYEAVDAVRLAMEGLLAPELRENQLGAAVIKEVFKISKVGLVAGCLVVSGVITKGAKARLIRDDVEVADSRIGSLRRHQDEVKDVQNNLECGITIDKVSDLRAGDRIETYETVEVARKLSA
jgi:translation initiation factor IF-2